MKQVTLSSSNWLNLFSSVLLFCLWINWYLTFLPKMVKLCIFKLILWVWSYPNSLVTPGLDDFKLDFRLYQKFSWKFNQRASVAKLRRSLPFDFFFSFTTFCSNWWTLCGIHWNHGIIMEFVDQNWVWTL